MENEKQKKLQSDSYTASLLITLIFSYEVMDCRAEETNVTNGINCYAENSEKALSDLELNGDDIEKKISELIEENESITPSVSIRVFGQNDDICSVIYGMADTENNIAADEETVYE
ncbi:MAG: hypothetical protein ACI4I1_08615 [Oscillospiraceae bacterium]